MLMYELPKESILKKNEFNTVYHLGRSYVNKELIMHVIKSADIKGKIGFAVGKKIGNAVVRNRIKRLMREAYRHSKSEINADVSMILIARKTLIETDFKDVTRSLKDICKRAKIWSHR